MWRWTFFLEGGSGWAAVLDGVGMRRLGRSEWCKNGRDWWGIERDMDTCLKKKKKGNKKYI
jgi:hypothetical protein